MRDRRSAQRALLRFAAVAVGGRVVLATVVALVEWGTGMAAITGSGAFVGSFAGSVGGAGWTELLPVRGGWLAGTTASVVPGG